MDDNRRTRVSLGPPSALDQENEISAVPRKRAMSLAGTQASRRSLAPRKSILKQHVPLPVTTDDTTSVNGDFEQSVSDAPSALRSRKSEAGRRVSFAANAQVRLFDKQQGTPSPAGKPPASRVNFASEEDPPAPPSPMKRRSVSMSRRRSSLASSPLKPQPSMQPVSLLIPFPGSSQDPSTDVGDDDSNMDIDEEPMDEPDTSVADMSIASAVSLYPSLRRESQVEVDDTDMSIAMTEFNAAPSPPRSFASSFPRSPSRRSSVFNPDVTADMSIANTEYPVLDGGRASMDLASVSTPPPSSPALNPFGNEEAHSSHEFVVPLGSHIPRTDSNGQPMSPSPAEKAKAAALASLGALSRSSGANADDDEDDDDEAPVIPIRVGNDMSLEAATERLRAASEGLEMDLGDQTSSTMSIDSGGSFTGVHGEATINVTAARKSLLLGEEHQHESPPPSLSQANTSKEKEPVMKATTSLLPKSVFTPATPTRLGIPKSPAKPKPTFTAAFAPRTSVSPRKRPLSAPSPSPSPAKKRAMSVGPSLSPSKTRGVVVHNIFQNSPARTISNSRPPPLASATAKRNPFLDHPGTEPSAAGSSSVSPDAAEAGRKNTPSPSHAPIVPSPLASSQNDPSLNEVPVVSELRQRSVPPSFGVSVPQTTMTLPEKAKAPLINKPVHQRSARPSLTASTAGPSRRRLSVLSSANRRSSVLHTRPSFVPTINDIVEEGTQELVPPESSIDGPFNVDIDATAASTPPKDLSRPQTPIRENTRSQFVDGESTAASSPSRGISQPSQPVSQAPKPVNSMASVEAAHNSTSMSINPEDKEASSVVTLAAGKKTAGRQSISGRPSLSRRESLSNGQSRPRRLSLALRGRQSTAATLVSAVEPPGANGNELPIPTVPDAVPVSLPAVPSDPDPDPEAATKLPRTIPSLEPRVRRTSTTRRQSLAHRPRLSHVADTNPALSKTGITSSPLTSFVIPEYPIQSSPKTVVEKPKPRSTFGRASFTPAPRPSVLSQSLSINKSSSQENADNAQTPRMTLAEFVEATGNHFQDLKVDRPLVLPHAAASAETDSENIYKLADIIKATMVHYPQLDLFETCVSEMSEQVTLLEKECQEMSNLADQSMPDVILNWLEGDDEERDIIKSLTKIRKTHASFQAQATWLAWRQENIDRALETAKIHDEELRELDESLEAIIQDAPEVLAALQEEHDRIKAELDAEHALAKELEEYDQSELEDAWADIEAQKVEVEEAAAAVRQARAQLEAVQGRSSEIKSQVEDAERAINSANASAQQSRGDSIEEAARLKSLFETLQSLHLWRSVQMKSDIFEMDYDGRYRVTIACQDYQAGVVRFSIVPDSSGTQCFPYIDELMFSLGNRALSRMQQPKDLKKVIRVLDSIWGSLVRLSGQLRMLKLWPVKLEAEGGYGLRATAKVMLKTVRGRADIAFIFTEEVLRSWPALISELQYEVALKYGDASADDIDSIVREEIANAAPNECHGVLARACAEVRNAYLPPLPA